MARYMFGTPGCHHDALGLDDHDDAMMQVCHHQVDILVMITATITIKMTLTQATSQRQKVPWSLHCWGGY